MSKSELKTYIRTVLAESKIDKAGFVIFRDDQVLVLVDSNEKYDLPKGRLKKNETPLQAAERETKEETGIIAEMPFGDVGFAISDKIFFVGTTDQDPYIAINPETGIREHVAAIWLPPQEAATKLGTELGKAVLWATEQFS